MLIQLIAMIWSVASIASTQVVGNGGHGINDNGKIYSLDLYEYQLQNNAYFMQLAPKIEILAKVRAAFPTLSPNLTWLLGSKLQEIYNINPAFSLALVKAIEFYRWEFSDEALPPVDDEKLNDQPEFKGKLIQLAVRSHYSISVDRNFFNEMDEANEVALIVHEAVHAMIKPESEAGAMFSFQSEKRSRSIVAALFSSGLNADHLEELVSGIFPSARGQVIFEDKNVLVMGTSLVLIEDGKEIRNFALPSRSSELMGALKAALTGPGVSEVALTGFSDSFEFSPMIYTDKARESHWYLGFIARPHYKEGPSMILNSKVPGQPLFPLGNSVLTFENLCGDELFVAFPAVTDEKLSYALPCLQEWLTEPSAYY